ncbi:MAG: hypothetical protein K0R00_2698 [Herbinix sp.]|jgi:hypothetical protein|nr:hypothetical protein [Herbinix sp.]
MYVKVGINEMKAKLTYLLIIIILILIALVVVFYTGKKHASNYSDLVQEFYNMESFDIMYSSYNSWQPGHTQPVLVVSEQRVNVISDYLFLRPLFYSKRTDIDFDNINLRSLGILNVLYDRGSTIEEKSFVRILTYDNVVYYKSIIDTEPIMYDSYYPGIEADILEYMENEDWYSYILDE